MAQVIEFTKNVQTGMYESEITPTGSRLAVQVKFDEQDASFQPASAYMNVLAQIDSESDKVFVADVEMWQDVYLGLSFGYYHHPTDGYACLGGQDS